MGNFFGEISGIVAGALHHRRQYQIQREAYNEMIATLEDGHVVVVADFQERYTHHEQDEVQSQHWNYQSTTLFPAPRCFRLNDDVWTYSFVMLSDDKHQDSAWVQHNFKLLLDVEIPSLLQRVGAEPMTRATFWTDNCGKQLKCQYSFGFIGNVKAHAAGRPDERLHVEAHYFGACHGKSLSGSEGGVVKTYAKSKVVCGQWVISSSFDLFAKLAPALIFDLRAASGEEAEYFTRPVRTNQTLMTKKVCDGRFGEYGVLYLRTAFCAGGFVI